MEDHLYIVLWRVNETCKWDVERIVYSTRDRNIIIEAAKIRHPDFQYAWVEGPICTLESMAEAELRLGSF
jgi:hypothetical protein